MSRNPIDDNKIIDLENCISLGNNAYPASKAIVPKTQDFKTELI